MYSGGSICVCVCVYVKHTIIILEGDNTLLLALQQLAREGILQIVAVIHTEKAARAEKILNSINYKQIKITD